MFSNLQKLIFNVYTTVGVHSPQKVIHGQTKCRRLQNILRLTISLDRFQNRVASFRQEVLKNEPLVKLSFSSIIIYKMMLKHIFCFVRVISRLWELHKIFYKKKITITTGLRFGLVNFCILGAVMLTVS